MSLPLVAHQTVYIQTERKVRLIRLRWTDTVGGLLPAHLFDHMSELHRAQYQRWENRAHENGSSVQAPDCGWSSIAADSECSRDRLTRIPSVAMLITRLLPP